MLKSICISETGLVREKNQDRAGQFWTGEFGLYLVADGMGGHYAGEMASETVFSACSQWWNTYLNAPQRPGFMQAVEQLRGVIQDSNTKIRQLTPPNEICGTTLVLLWIAQKDYALFTVGDSRCYQVYSRGPLPSIVQLSTDDVVRDSPDSRNNGKLLRALGPKEQCELTLQTGDAPANTIFALCSDGIYKACPRKEWTRALRKAAFGTSLQDTGVRISQEVLKHGAPDNYSLVLIRT